MLRLALLKKPQQVLQRHSRIKDVLDNDDCFPLDAGIQVPCQPHLPRRVCLLPVTRHRDEIKRNFPRNIPRQVGQEKNSALQNAHQVQRLVWKISPDFLRQRLNPSLNPPPRNQHPDALPRRSRTLLPGFSAFLHAFPRTWHRDSSARAFRGQGTLVTLHSSGVHTASICVPYSQPTACVGICTPLVLACIEFIASVAPKFSTGFRFKCM